MSYRYEYAVIDGHGHVAFPDKCFSIEELRKDLNGEYKLRIIFDSKYTVAVENASKVIVGWINVNILGFENVESMIRKSFSKAV